MKNHLFIKLFFLLSIFSVTRAQDSIYRIDPIPVEVLRTTPQQVPAITLIADRNPVQIREQVKFTLLPEEITTRSSFTYKINFGDGSQAVKENGKSYFLHEYRSVGSFTISVSIEIPGGAEIFVPKPVMANIITMQVKNVSLFVKPTNVEVGQTVAFETKFNSINKNVRYNFNFGDNSSSGWLADQNSSHPYSRPGTYFVSAEINGLDGSSLYPITITERKKIEVKTPFSVKLNSDNIKPKVYDNITLTASSNRQENGLEYWFNFGDNMPIQKSLRPVISKVYTKPGDYQVSVQLAPNGNPTNVSSVIPIKVLPITVELIAGNTNIFAGDKITFSALTNSTKPDIKYLFTFGENNNVTASNISSINHTYSESGNFIASVQLSINNEPITNPVTLPIFVSPQIKMSLKADKLNAIENEKIIFEAIISSTNNGFRYEFNFGDNTQSQTVNNSTISHSYLHSGNYNVSVKLVKDSKVLSSAEVPINIFSRKYIVALKVDRPDSQTGDTITFTASSNYHDIGLKYLFNFGDNTPVQITRDSIIQHIYNSTRNFAASVQLLLNNIPQAQDTFEVKINLLPPNSVILSVESDSDDTESTFIFTAISRNQRSGLEYWFYTGDKSQPIRTLMDTIHYHYSDTGIYTTYVKLIINGREAAISQNVEIKVTSNDFLWWLYLVAALIILAGGVLIRKSFKAKSDKEKKIPDVNPTFYPYPDRGFSNFKEPKRFNVNYEVHFNLNLANANHLLKLPDENLIKSKSVEP